MKKQLCEFPSTWAAQAAHPRFALVENAIETMWQRPDGAVKGAKTGMTGYSLRWRDVKSSPVLRFCLYSLTKNRQFFIVLYSLIKSVQWSSLFVALWRFVMGICQPNQWKTQNCPGYDFFVQFVERLLLCCVGKCIAVPVRCAVPTGWFRVRGFHHWDSTNGINTLW